MNLRLRLVVGVLGLMLLANSGSLFASGWRAGVAKVKITPEHLIWMSGYGSRTHPAEGKLTDLWAKALVIEDGDGRRGVVITLDLVGISPDLTVPICEALARRHKLTRDQIAICTSHTHTGPVVGANLKPLHYLQVEKPEQLKIDAYAGKLKEHVIAVVGQAIEKMEACELSWGSDKATFAVNRRNNPEAQVPKLREDGQLKGPFDHDVPVLAVKSSGKLRAVVFGYACHATVLSFYQWSGDYPGFAQAAVEESHPGCVALFFAGCGADQNPLPRRKVEQAKEYGGRLAKAVDRVLMGELKPLSASLKTAYREIPLPLDKLPSREDLSEDTESQNKYVAARARMLLEQLDEGKPLSPTYPYPVGSWRIGEDVEFITLGGEVVVDYALRLKLELRGTQTWVAGYANDVMAYIPSRRVLREGGYEGGGAMIYYGLPTKWSPEVEEAIVKQVHEQLKGGK